MFSTETGFEILFCFDFLTYKLRIEQPGQATVICLAAILGTEQCLACATSVFPAPCTPVCQQNFVPFDRSQPERHRLIAKVFQLGHGEQPARSSRVTGDEY